MIDLKDLDPYLVKIDQLEHSLDKIRDGVCFTRCSYLVKKKMSFNLLVYLWCVEALIWFAKRICQIQIYDFDKIKGRIRERE